MIDRQVIEWDKDDIDALKFMKVDVLALGMLEDWPHRACVDAVVTEMHTQRYSARSIYHFVQAARGFVAWRSDTMGAVPLGYDEIDRFVVHRQAAGALRNGERKAPARLREAMVQAGVMMAPTPAAGPADDVLRRFEISLVRRGYRPASVSSYIWFCRPFIVELWDGAELTKSIVLSYIERHAGERGHCRHTIRACFDCATKTCEARTRQAGAAAQNAFSSQQSRSSPCH
jgi:hypothetical protein